MENGMVFGDRSIGAEEASVDRTVAFLRGELERLAPASPAAVLYEEFIAAMDKVYPPSARTEAFPPGS